MQLKYVFQWFQGLSTSNSTILNALLFAQMSVTETMFAPFKL